MQKFISVFTLALLFATITFGQGTLTYRQATVEIPFTVEDNDGNSQTLNFGLDLTATPGLDPGLESELPPLPPTGVFDARFVSSAAGGSTLGQGSLNDIRNAPIFPFTGQKIHQIYYQVGGVATEVTISWDLPLEILPSSVIQDLFGGSFYSASFSGTNSITIAPPFGPTIVTGLEIIIDYDAIVPVELTSFTASVNESEVVLSWTTATEVNNSGFNVERNSGNGFETLGFVPGFGTTTESRSYSFTDADLHAGRYIYRLKQVDLDGSFEYSDEIAVEVITPLEFALGQNYPNPFNPSTVIEFSLPEDVNDVQLTIYDALGQKVAQLVNTSLQAGRYSYQWDARNVSTGMYIYELRTNKFVSIKKMMILK